MKNSKHIFFLLLLTSHFSFLTSRIFSQDFLGYSNSNYAGVSGIDLNPASIADSRFKFDMTLVGANVFVANNYIALNHAGKKFITSKDTGGFDKNKFLVENTNSNTKSAFLSNRIALPSFMITLSPKSAIAFTASERSIVNIDGIDEPLASQINKSLKDSSNFLRQLSNKNLSIGAMAWVEYGITYSRVIIDDKHNFIKAGLRIKYLQGLGAAYLSVKDFSYNVQNDSTISFNTNANFGGSNYILGALASSLPINSFSSSPVNIHSLSMQSKFSLGFDLGMIYEWRPDREKYFYDMDGKTGLDMRYKNKYKLKAGFSVLDIGRIKFVESSVGDFTANMQNWDYTTAHFNSNKSVQANLDSIFKANGGGSVNMAPQSFKMHLPTTMSSQIDYNIWKDFYANFTAYYAFQFPNDASKVHEITTFSLTPRWDWKWFGVFVPASSNIYGTHVGLSLRLGPLILGTTNLAPILGKSDIYGFDFHFLLKVYLRYHKPKDRDGDHVSNKKDKCPDVPGVWEFAGCPDRDGDHIPDNIDECPDQPGLPQFNGCPDRDGDGIPDKKDSCPDVAGLPQFNGCPDRDGDGIIDKLDSCPDEAGLPQFNGCPDRDHDGVMDKYDLCPTDSGSVATHGCPDRDGDGVLDKDDRCPDKAGPKENDGCPLAQLHLMDKQGNIIGTATVDKEGNFIFVDLPIDENSLMKLESYDVLIANEATVVSGKFIRVARRGVDGFFHFEALKADENKTGTIETPDVQIKLNKEEAQTIKHAMETLEFDFGSDIIRPTSTDGLDLVTELLTQNHTWRLKLSGHTDNVSSLKYNMNLSKKRVESIKKYLGKKGIDPNRIVLKWYGPTKPIAPNNTEEGRQKNRRVEFLMIK